MVTIQFSFFFLATMVICFAGTSCKAEEIADENVRKLAEANNELALSLYKLLAFQSSGNVFFSPLSLSTAFGMLYNGAKGETAKELRQILGYEAAGLPEELVHSTFQRYLTRNLPSQDPSAYVFNSANAALLDKKFDVLSFYENDIRDYYQATVKKVDFSTENNQILQEVNKFVKDKTNGKIEKFLDVLNPSTVFILLNAVYFKGTWENKFEESLTAPNNFYNGGLLSEAKEVPMMTLQEKFPYMTDDELGVDVIEMPYKGRNISMMVLLPHERDGLEALENNLSLEKLKNIRYKLIKTKVILIFPKFKFEYFKDMTSDFVYLGSESAFSPGADFSEMTKSGNVCVSQVLHKAVIEVNEEGSEAAAATAILVLKMSLAYDYPELMIVNHPFLFFIVDRRNDMILFAGRVTNL